MRLWSLHPRYLDWKGLGANWREVGSGCSVCFRVCNFTKEEGVSHDIVKWFIRNVPQLNRFWVWTDDLLGYGKMSDPSKYWDLPYRKS